MHVRSCLRGLAALAALAAVPAQADVKAGVDAWSAGDYARAVREWAEPAAAGDADAQFNLAQAYRLGRGVDSDVEQAAALYRLAAQQGHLRAADNFGLLLFQEGRREEAMPFVTAAAERGDPRAQYLLGVAHFNGDLAPRDWVRAYALATLAHSAGVPQARSAIAQMDEHIPLDQRQQAQSLALTLKSAATATRATDLAAADLALATEPPAQLARAAPGAARPAPAQTAPAAPAVARAEPAARSAGPWKVQLGAFGVAGNADRLWARLSTRPELAGAIRLTEPAGRLTKLLAGGFATQGAAQAACAALRATGQECLVTR